MQFAIALKRRVFESLAVLIQLKLTSLLSDKKYVNDIELKLAIVCVLTRISIADIKLQKRTAQLRIPTAFKSLIMNWVI